jgi:hypothetical protein
LVLGSRANGKIAIFAPIALVVDEWCQNDPDVKVDAAWRVFEISSGDEGDTANYGESSFPSIK